MYMMVLFVGRFVDASKLPFVNLACFYRFSPHVCACGVTLRSAYYVCVVSKPLLVGLIHVMLC